MGGFARFWLAQVGSSLVGEPGKIFGNTVQSAKAITWVEIAEVTVCLGGAHGSLGLMTIHRASRIS